MDRVTLAYEPDPSDGLGRLRASVVTGGFCGYAETWAQVDHLRDFSGKLMKFPLPPNHPTEFRLGYNELEGEDLVLRICVDASDPRGHLNVIVEIASDLGRHGSWEPRKRTQTNLVTHYPDVERFALQLGRLGETDATEAVLNGS